MQVIALSDTPEKILRVLEGEKKIGTTFHAQKKALIGRKRWILAVSDIFCFVLESGFSVFKSVYIRQFTLICRTSDENR